MMSPKELTQRIGFALERRPLAAELEALAAEYAKLARVTNKRLEMCGELLASGKRENALAMAESTPSVFGAALALRCEHAAAWSEFCRENNLPVPETFNEVTFLKLEELHKKRSPAATPVVNPRPQAVPAPAPMARIPAPMAAVPEAPATTVEEQPADGQLQNAAEDRLDESVAADELQQETESAGAENPPATPVILAAIVPEGETGTPEVAVVPEAVPAEAVRVVPVAARSQRKIWVVLGSVAAAVLMVVGAGGAFWWWASSQSSDKVGQEPDNGRRSAGRSEFETTNTVATTGPVSTNPVQVDTPARSADKAITRLGIASAESIVGSVVSTAMVAGLAAKAESGKVSTKAVAPPTPVTVPTYMVRESQDGILPILQRHYGISISAAMLPQRSVVRVQKYAGNGWPNPMTAGEMAEWHPNGRIYLNADYVLKLNEAHQLVAQDKSTHWAIHMDQKMPAAAGSAAGAFQILLLSGLTLPPLEMRRDALVFQGDSVSGRRCALSPAAVERLQLLQPMSASSQVRLLAEKNEKGAWAKSFVTGGLQVNVMPDGTTIFASQAVEPVASGGVPRVDYAALQLPFGPLVDYYAAKLQELDRKRAAASGLSPQAVEAQKLFTQGSLKQTGRIVMTGISSTKRPSSFPSSSRTRPGMTGSTDAYADYPAVGPAGDPTWEKCRDYLRGICAQAFRELSTRYSSSAESRINALFQQLPQPPRPPVGLESIPMQLTAQLQTEIQRMSPPSQTRCRERWRQFSQNWRLLFTTEVMGKLAHLPSQQQAEITRQRTAELDSERDVFVRWRNAVPVSPADMAAVWLEWRPVASQPFVRFVEFRKTET